MADDPNLPATVTAPVTLPATIQLTEHTVAKLAHELAMNIRDRDVILLDYGLTPAVFESTVQQMPFFRRVYESAVLEWEAADNTAKRLKLKAQYGLENNMAHLAARMSNEKETLPAKVEAAKLFAKIAGVDAAQAQPIGSGEKFTITINLGEDHKLKYEREVNPTASASPDVSKEVRTISEGESGTEPVRPLTKGA